MAEFDVILLQRDSGGAWKEFQITVPADSVLAFDGVSRTPTAKLIADISGSSVADASETVKGIVELATDGETTAGLAVQANDSRLSNKRGVNFVTVPASATAAGTAGDVAYDTDYVYVCVATDTWKRQALGTWA